MPIYEYVCNECGKLAEVWQKVNDPAPEKCEGCGAPGKMTKVVSRTSFVLKGGGWYSDLYSSKKKDGGSSASGTSSASSTAGTSSASTAPASSPAPSASSSSSASTSSGSSSSSGSGDKK